MSQYLQALLPTQQSKKKMEHICGLSSSGMLGSIMLVVFTGVSWQPMAPAFKAQEVFLD